MGRGKIGTKRLGEQKALEDALIASANEGGSVGGNDEVVPVNCDVLRSVMRALCGDSSEPSVGLLAEHCGRRRAPTLTPFGAGLVPSKAWMCRVD